MSKKIDTTMSLIKILQSQGFGSRNVCAKIIKMGMVNIDGEKCYDGNRLFPLENLDFEVDGKKSIYKEKLYILMDKPDGYECSHNPDFHASVFSLLPNEFLGRNLQCVGRLDVDTTGLLLFSDDGEFIHRYTSPKKHIPKTYLVECKHEVSDEMIEALLNGVLLKQEEISSKALSVNRKSTHEIELSISEGKYHQVKRMISAAGNRVEKLRRISVGEHTIPSGLEQGKWVYLE
jgi:16S rRNA pseudouridine516 synthase